MWNRQKAELVFAEELSLIENEMVKSFVLDTFEQLVPSYFWDGPASSTGKHHPKVSNKKHGLVLHTKLAVWWAKKLYEPMRTDATNFDVIIASLLIHDLKKFGEALVDGRPTLTDYASTHGVLLASELEEVLWETNPTHPDFPATDKWLRFRVTGRKIITCVANHMGRWTNKDIGLKYECAAMPGREKEIVQLADYCASKKAHDKIERLDNWEFPKEAL